MKKHIAIFGSIALGATLFLSGCSTTSTAGVKSAQHKAKYTHLTTEQAKAHFDEKKGLFVDARPSNLYMIGTIMGATNIPNDSDWLKKNVGILPADKDALLISFCNGPKCHHSEELADKLTAMGYTNIIIYPGGYPEWKEFGYQQMGLLRECETTIEGEYTPKRDAIVKNGVEVYPGGMPGMVDQDWLSPMLEAGKIPEGIQLIDVRKAEQFNEGHIAGAINVTYADGKMDESKLPTDKLSVLYCNTGMTSTEAYSALSKDAKARALYIDATVKCDGNDCSVEPNMDLSDLF